MKPENKSNHLLKIVKSKAKMWEYGLPQEAHNVNYTASPDSLFPLTIGLLGDLCRKINNGEDTSDLDKTFSPQFFDAFIDAKFDTETNDYLYLLGASAFYLADMPGSSSVLAHRVSEQLCVEAEGLELLLKQLLLGKLEAIPEIDTEYKESIRNINTQLIYYFATGAGTDILFQWVNCLQKSAYAGSNSRCLLLADIIGSVVRKKIDNSTWKLLSEYSQISKEIWAPTLSLDNFIKELWPAQKLIGNAGCYNGTSAVIQMPTSAGKTKSTEIILRSAFLSDRAVKLAVIVAPFCALCHEIKDSLVVAFSDGLANVCEVSDVLQIDLTEEILALFEQPQIDRHYVLILTPEKLLYVLRHSSDLATKIGLIIFDEAHQFDSGKRGITYELLLTELKMLLAPQTQKILISAVISNAESIAEWFNDTNLVVRGENLTAMSKSIGFAHWIDRKGQITYRDNENIDNEDFFVPRVIEEIELEKKGKERKVRTFPQKNDSGSISLYLGLKLAGNGAVAIFCGQKRTANKLSEILADALDRNLRLDMPIIHSDQNEIEALYKLLQNNMGETSNTAQIAKFGIFQHHGNMPHGIRIAVEHAIKEGLVKFVICTSTLAQGVNLPIRYLIIANSRLGIEQIKVRDFHNLIGRAGRAGKHTEGSILFADHTLYDSRNSEKWRWQETKNLLDMSKSENCTSSILDLFNPIKSDDAKRVIDITTLNLVKLILEKDFNELIEKIRKQLEKSGFDKELKRQMQEKKEQINAIESFLLSKKIDDNLVVEEMSAELLAKQTFAYFLADEEKRKEICDVFKAVSENIDIKAIPKEKQKIYGKTLLDLESLNKIEQWLIENVASINAVNDTIEMLSILWPILSQYVNDKIVDKLEIVKNWINGNSFAIIAQKMNDGLEKPKWSPDDATDLFENKLAFESSLVFGAIIDISFDMEEISEDSKNLILLLQKQIKYGLPTRAEIMIYEIGFVDRVIALDLKNSLNIDSIDRRYIKNILKTPKASEIMSKYPAYFRNLQSSL